MTRPGPAATPAALADSERLSRQDESVCALPSSAHRIAGNRLLALRDSPTERLVEFGQVAASLIDSEVGFRRWVS